MIPALRKQLKALEKWSKNASSLPLLVIQQMLPDMNDRLPVIPVQPLVAVAPEGKGGAGLVVLHAAVRAA